MYSLGCKLKRVAWILHYWLLNETYFIWLEALTMLLNNTINIFLINPNNYFILCSFHQIFMDIYNILSINRIKISTKKFFTSPFNPVGFFFFFYFILLIAKSFEIFPKHNE